MSTSEGYRLVRSIGAGVTGAMYVGETSTGQVAVRQFQSQFPNGTEEWKNDRQQFLQAARQAQNLSHPRIVRVIEVIDEEGEAFEAMEYVQAMTLQSAIVGQRFTPEEADVILRQIAIALDYAHGCGVVHGDLKPSNIFLATDGAKVSDFAVSIRARRDLRRPLSPALIHPYLSPEHLRNPASISFQSDQYSLAAIAYELYTGQPLCSSTSEPGSAILNASVLPPSKVNRRLPSSVDASLLRALNQDAAQRYPSCMGFISALDASLITHTEARGSKKSPKLLYAGVTSLLVAALGIVLLWPSPKPKPALKPTATKPVAAPAPATAPSPVTIASTKKKKSEPKAARTGEESRTVAHVAKVSPFSGEPPARSRLSDNSENPSRQRTTSNRQANPTLEARSELVTPAQTPGTASPTLPSDRPAPISSSVSTRDFSIDVLSRDHHLENGSSFAAGDTVLGELGQGDLKAIVHYNGQQTPKGQFSLLWRVDGIPTDAKRVSLNQVVEYGNEPTSGSYRVELLQGASVVQSFTFRITP